MPYTNINKPTGTGYTNINTAKPSFDEPSLSFDDSSTFYDGISQAAYTNVSKPTGGTTLQVGMTMGLLIPLTNSRNINIGSPYINISKPV